MTDSEVVVYDRRVHHRRSIRLAQWDYASPATYFVTICTRERASLLGTIWDAKLEISDVGRVAAQAWQWLPSQYSYVALDDWCVMPNHVHGILRIEARDDVAKVKPLGQLIGAFKTVSTKRANALRETPGAALWQRNYWEHVVRDETELNRLREYIRDNPAKWALDVLNPT